MFMQTPDRVNLVPTGGGLIKKIDYCFNFYLTKNRNMYLFQFFMTYFPIQTPLFFTKVAGIISHIK